MTGDEYARAVGERLRRIRVARGMSLGDVQESSGRLWKAAVVGAYERGDRNITIARLAELGEFYGVPVAEIIPGDGAPASRTGGSRRVVLNLERLDGVPESDRDPLRRLVASIQERRGEAGGRVVTIRESDLMPLALLYRTSPEGFARKLEEWGLATEAEPA
ncbi:MAG: transcriptional regulator [Actinobacteria bacterium]|nr:transcriptional regulator [Actinomycetota bacterium]